MHRAVWLPVLAVEVRGLSESWTFGYVVFALRVRGHPSAVVRIPARGREGVGWQSHTKKCKPCTAPGLKQAPKAEVAVEGSSLLRGVFLSLFKMHSGSAECNYSVKDV